MKIEIGESLVSSYLNHVEQCRIVQTNWRVSGNWTIGEQESFKPRRLFKKIQGNELLGAIFKESSFEQLIKQAEIDVLGINTVENTVYAYDIAFHGAGLNYTGGKEATCETVIKKIFRAIFAIQIYFPESDKIESFFVTPKSNKSTDELLKKYIEVAIKIIDDENIIIGYLSNVDFFENIVDKVIESTINENDTSELFLRAIKLSQLDKRTRNIKAPTISQSPISITSDKRRIDGMKIGQYVKNSMFELLKGGLLTNDIVNDLMDLEYCKITFGIGFPILKHKSESVKDINGNNRYYRDEIIPGYWLCSQWVERYWDKYLSWEGKLKS